MSVPSRVHVGSLEGEEADQSKSKKTTELDLRREFEMYGAIERIRIVQDRKGKSRSFAFIVYERERDMKGGCLSFGSNGPN